MIGQPVHAIVVAFHVPERLDACLAAIAHALPVIVVDNSSAPEVAAVAHRHGADYLDSGRNRGYAAAVNLGLAHVAATEADVLLLNPDAVLRPGALAELVRFLHLPANARVAAVAPRLVEPTGSEQRVVWPFPSPARMCMEAIGLGRIPSRKAFLAGAVLLLRCEAIADVGPFDDRFFLYAEEADWQRRAADRGWRSAVCSSVRAQHIGAGTSSDERRREILFHAAQETFIRKWFGAVGWAVYRFAACSGAGIRAVALTPARRGAATRRMHLYLRGPCRCAADGAD